MMSTDLGKTRSTVVLPPISGTVLEAPSVRLIDALLQQFLVLHEDWEALPHRVQRKILESEDQKNALEQLVRHGLLTRYQAGRVDAGTVFGLILGSYRILERLGAGGMAVVFKAEHMDLRHHVAVKVLPPTTKEDSAIESRFFAEMRIVARLRHPNIVAATDAGRTVSEDGNTVLRYLVMEYVAGADLEHAIRRHGPMSPSKACSIAYQIASALNETHKYGLVHRDIKPSNIKLAKADHAKLLDFGLTRHFGHRMTVPGTVLGTIDYMAPEQARDSSKVDIRADIFGLGATLFRSLTGQLPFACGDSPVDALTRRLNAPTPSIRDWNPELPKELDAIVGKMMANNPEDRFENPAAVMQAFLPFVRSGSGEMDDRPEMPRVEAIPVVTLPEAKSRTEKSRVLIVDDDSAVRDLCKRMLEVDGAQVETAANGAQGLAMAAKGAFDLILLDVAMPGLNGVEVLTNIRQQQAKGTHLKILMFSGNTTPEEMSEMLGRGADDFLAKPFSMAQLQARAQNLLRLKAAQDQAAEMNQRLLVVNSGLEEDLKVRGGSAIGVRDVESIRNALVLAITSLFEQRDGGGTGHPLRMQKYCRVLAEAAAGHEVFSSEIDCQFVDLLEACAPVYDVGRVAIPEHVLMKVGSPAPEDRLMIEMHTTIGCDAFRDAMQSLGKKGVPFLKMAADIARSHHERHDGTGYPDRLAGSAIPLAARLVAIADVYDGLRCRRLNKPAMPHSAAVQTILQNSPGQFDPAILEVFEKVAPRFEAIYRETPD